MVIEVWKRKKLFTLQYLSKIFKIPFMIILIIYLKLKSTDRVDYDTNIRALTRFRLVLETRQWFIPQLTILDMSRITEQYFHHCKYSATIIVHYHCHITTIIHINRLYL